MGYFIQFTILIIFIMLVLYLIFYKEFNLMGSKFLNRLNKINKEIKGEENE